MIKSTFVIYYFITLIRKNGCRSSSQKLNLSLLYQLKHVSTFDDSKMIDLKDKERSD